MNVPRGLEYLREAQHYQGEWPRFHLGWLYQGLAIASFLQVRIDDAIRNARQATKIWRDASIPLWTTSEAGVAQYLMLKGRHRESAALIDEIQRVVQGNPDPGQIQSATWTAAWIQMYAARNPLEARRLYAVGTASPRLSSYQNEANFEFLAFTEILLGNLARAKELAAKHRMNPIFRGLLALYEGDLDKALDSRRAVIEWGQRVGHIWDAVDSSVHLASTLYVSGDPIQALQVLEGVMQKCDPGIHALQMSFRPLAVLLEIEMQRPERAVEHIEICRQIVAEDEDWKGTGGRTDRAEGVLAAVEGRPFAKHFEKAVAVFKQYSLPFEEAETLVNWGRALLSKDNQADANAMFDAAVGIYRRCGVGDGYIDLIEKRRTAFPYRIIASSLPHASISTFRREGDFWTIAHNGKNLRLRNLKGLSYIAHLLRRPGERVHVIDLVQAIEGGADVTASASARVQGVAVERGLGDIGETLDGQALREYRRRQSELKAELEAAWRDNDPRRVESAQHELEMISDALKKALGRGGRVRKNFSHTERARSLVTKHIRRGIDLIRNHDSELANQLDATIHTGAYCSYLP